MNNKTYLINTILLFCMLLFSMCGKKNEKEESVTPVITQEESEQNIAPLEKETVNSQNFDNEENKEVDEVEKYSNHAIKNMLLGTWKAIRQHGDMNSDWAEGGECYISLRIEEKNDIFLYHFTSHLRTMSDTLSITHYDHEIVLTFEGIEWAYQDENVTDSPKPSNITATFNPSEEHFVIQNDGNAMNDYRKLGEGCEKYLFFEKEYPVALEFSEEDQQLIEGYSILHAESGDINNDQKLDYVLVLQSDIVDEDGPMPFSYNRKVVLVEQTNATPPYRIMATNDRLIECSQCGGAGVGDPFQGITIKDGYFSIEQLFGACTKDFFVVTFKYEKGSFLLNSIGKNTGYCNQVENGEIKTSSKRKKVQDFGKIEFKDFDFGNIYKMFKN
ncbi:hypothetical protein [Aquimarina algicola]|nr:hypothetical protein [Aquimarina algicola]